MILNVALVLLVAAATAMPQSPSKIDLLKRVDELESAISAGDWKTAAGLSDSLKDAVRNARNQSMAGSGSEIVESILNWLPADTETLVVAREPFTMLERDRAETPRAVEMAQGYVLGLLSAAENQNLRKALLGRTVRLATVGARRFAHRPQSGLGMIAYQGCAVYVFAEPVLESTLSRDRDEAVMGYPVWISKGSQSDRPQADTIFVSLLKPDVVLVCNDRDFLTDMVSRMSSPKTPRALPESLPEWRQVDRAAPLWAVRHYRADRLRVDPSMPSNIVGAGIDSESVGFTVEFGPASSVRARMISRSDPWSQLVGNDDFSGAAQSREVTNGVWELSVAGKQDAAVFAVFVVMSVLGFLVFI